MEFSKTRLSKLNEERNENRKVSAERSPDEIDGNEITINDQ